MTDKLSPAGLFRAMADRIDKNPTEFAGAFCIVAPDGTVTSHTFFNPTGDDIAFWGFVQNTVQVVGNEAVQREENKNRAGLGMRR